MVGRLDLPDAGFHFCAGVLDARAVRALDPVLAVIPSSAAGRRWAGAELALLLETPALDALGRAIGALLPGMAVLRTVAFKKDADANWFVPPHQDRSIPIPSDVPPPGFGNVTRKGGGWQAEAPIEILAEMRNCRIFVDAATEDDGPLEVIPGSHRRGRISQAGIAAVTREGSWHALTGAPGDLAVLSPLLLHRSRKAARPSGRRVLQIECIPTAVAVRRALDAHPLAV